MVSNGAVHGRSFDRSEHHGASKAAIAVPRPTRRAAGLPHQRLPAPRGQRVVDSPWSPLVAHWRRRRRRRRAAHGSPCSRSPRSTSGITAASGPASTPSATAPNARAARRDGSMLTTGALSVPVTITGARSDTGEMSFGRARATNASCSLRQSSWPATRMVVSGLSKTPRVSPHHAVVGGEVQARAAQRQCGVALDRHTQRLRHVHPHGLGHQVRHRAVAQRHLHGAVECGQDLGGRLPSACHIDDRLELTGQVGRRCLVVTAARGVALLAQCAPVGGRRRLAFPIGRAHAAHPSGDIDAVEAQLRRPPRRLAAAIEAGRTAQVATGHIGLQRLAARARRRRAADGCAGCAAGSRRWWRTPADRSPPARRHPSRAATAR